MTRPSRRATAANVYRSWAMLAVGVHTPVPGSYTSADDSAPGPLPRPPAARTEPSGRLAMTNSPLGTFMLPVADHVPDEGSKRSASAVGLISMPLATSTLPPGSTAVLASTEERGGGEADRGGGLGPGGRPRRGRGGVEPRGARRDGAVVPARHEDEAGREERGERVHPHRAHRPRAPPPHGRSRARRGSEET